jgi:hypothetical protein
MPATPTKQSVGEPESWAEYRRLVLAELERIGQEVARVDRNNATLQLTLHQAIADAKNNLTDKMRELLNRSEEEYDRKLAGVDARAHGALTTVDARSQVDLKALDTRFTDTTKSIKDEAKNIRDEQTKQGKDISSLKTTAALVGGAAGLIVAIAALIAGIVFKR